MSKRSRTVAFAAVLALAAGSSLWLIRDPAPAISSPAVEQTGKLADTPPAPVGSDAPVPLAGSGESGAVVKEIADDPPARAHPDDVTTGAPLPLAAGDFPPYLGAVAHSGPASVDPRGCKSPFKLLAEMSEESRDELWASRVERELRAMLGRHPLDLQVSVGCRATICQITEVGIVGVIEPADEQDWARYWGNFMSNLRSSPIASEFATSRFFAGRFSADLTPEPGEISSGYWDIAGYVLTSVGQATPSEPPDCAPFQPRRNDSPVSGDRQSRGAMST